MRFIQKKIIYICQKLTTKLCYLNNTKNMRKFFYTLFAIMAISACTEGGGDIGGENDNDTPKQAQITLDATTADFDTEGGSNTISFTSSHAWTAQIINDRADEWCSISPASGEAGNANITITTKANDTTDDRTASVVIKSGSTSKTILVSQRQKDALTITASMFEVGAEGGEVSIEVKANIDFEYSIEESAKDWVEYKTTRAMRSSNLVFDVKANSETEKRSAKITIKSGELSETIVIYQSGTEPAIVISQSEYILSSYENTIDVIVDSNVDVEVNIPADVEWIRENKTRAMSTNVYSFYIEPNESYDNRTAEIKFINKENNINEKVKITQIQINAIVLAESEYEFGINGGELDLEIQTNVDIVVTISDDAKEWIKQVETRGLETKSLHFDIAPCSKDVVREGKITLSGGDIISAVQEITVKQKEIIEIDAESIPSDEIWYRTKDDVTLNLDNLTQTPFDRKVLSNTYEKGVGKIKLDGPVTVIKAHSFNFSGLTELYLPDNIEIIERLAIASDYITTLRIPKNIRSIEAESICCTALSQFTGHNISDDGRCVIIDNVLYNFAPVGDPEYTLPSNVVEIAYCAIISENLEVLNLNEGLKILSEQAIFKCPKLRRADFPSTLESVGVYNFLRCNNIEGFYGNDKFHTSDNLCLITTNEMLGLKELSKFANAGLKEYTIPEGIEMLNNYVFHDNHDIEEVTFANSITYIASSVFENCTNLKAIYGPQTSSDHRSIVQDNELIRVVVTNGMPADYKIPDEITTIGYMAFQSNDKIVNVTMGDQVTSIGGYAFAHCPNLKTITLSGGLKYIGDGGATGGYNPFFRSDNLEAIYFRSYLPPYYLDPQMSDFPKLKVYIPSVSYDFYTQDTGWSTFKDYMVEYDCKDVVMPDFYVSTDFSKNGNVTQIQKTSEGKGIDLVLMGDGYLDSQINDGLYRQDMELAADMFFDVEPFKSFRHLFNIYVVDAVSAVEGVGNGPTAFSTYYQGMAAHGYTPRILEYTEKAVGEDRMDEVMAIVLLNDKERFAGVCTSYYPAYENDYSSGMSISLFPVGDRASSLAELVQHETGGHGFAKLGDEYYYEGRIPATVQHEAETQYSKYGWRKNVDFTSDPSKIRWSHFLSDSRYANEDLGIFEGGYTYSRGVWVPSQNSIMKSNTNGFNAPSREAIYYRIHKLAYGADWEYDYEKFVEWDAKNLKTATAVSTHDIPYKPTNFKPTSSPVVVKGSWKTELAR